MANCNRQQLNITCGTDVVLHDRLIFDGETFDPNLSVGIAANLVSSLGKRTALDVQVVDDELLISVPWIDGTLPGCYGLEVTGSCNSKKWATYADSLIKYTKATRIGVSEVTVESDSYDITQEVGFRYGEGGNVDDVKVNGVSVVSAGKANITMPTNVSQLANDSGYQTAQQVAKSIQDNLVPNAVVTVDANTGTPSATVTKNGNTLNFDFKNLKGKPFTYEDFTPQQLAGLVGPKGDQGDSAVYDPSSPDAPDFVMANTTGQSTTKAMTQKAVTDELMRISELPIKTVPENDIVYNAYRIASGKWQIGMSSQGYGYYINVVKYRGCKVVLTPQAEGRVVLLLTKNIGVNNPDVTEGDYAVIDGTVAAPGGDIIYAGEYTGGISSEEPIVATIPDDCNYLWTFQKSGSGGEIIKPASISIYRSESIEYAMGVIREEMSHVNDALIIDKVIGTQYYIGACENKNSAKSGGCFPVTAGKTYKMEFSTINWDCSDVQSTVNVLLVSNAWTSSIGDNAQLSQVIDMLTSTTMACKRTSNIPGQTIVFIPTSSWVQVIIRANLGEEINVTMTELSRLSQTNERVNALENDLESVKNGIGMRQDIVTVNGGFTELDAKLKALARRKNEGRTYQGNKPCLLLHFSDLHGYSGHLNRILEFRNTFSTYIDDVLHTGDTVNDQFGNINFLQDLGDNYVLNAIGNHDNWDTQNTEGDSINGRVLPTKVYAKFIKPFADVESGVVQPENAETNGLCYYYKDYVSSKLRLVILDCMMWNEAQANWFASTLNSAKVNGYSVLCVNHYCPHLSWTPIKECTFTSVVASIREVTPLNEYLNGEAVAILQNAINNGLEFVCWLFGHHHRDQFGYLEDYPSQFALAIDKAANNSSYERDSVRLTTGKTADCFNIVAVDTTCKIMTVMRIGNNRDKFMRQKNYLVLDYANGKILHNS